MREDSKGSLNGQGNIGLAGRDLMGHNAILMLEFKTFALKPVQIS